jgi:hypothetical protein
MDALGRYSANTRWGTLRDLAVRLLAPDTPLVADTPDLLDWDGRSTFDRPNRELRVRAEDTSTNAHTKHRLVQLRRESAKHGLKSH